MRSGQESLPVFCIYLHHNLEPGLWLGSIYRRLSGLDLPERSQSLPQVAENNTPRQMDVAGCDLLYDEL